jgi:mono/diheme cytochrome c family protein
VPLTATALSSRTVAQVASDISNGVGSMPGYSSSLSSTQITALATWLKSGSTTTTPSTTVPAAPGNLSATAASSTQVNLTWADNSNNETGFRIQRATNSGFSSGVTSIDVGAGVTSYSNTGLTASTTYYYRVRAYNSVGNSSYSSAVSVTTPSGGSTTLPAAPGNLSATAASSTQINLTWTDNSTNETGFRIQLATNSSFSSGLTTVNVGAGVTSYSATGLTASTTYYFRVYATNSAGTSSASNTASAATPAGSTLSGQTLFNTYCTSCHGLSTAQRTNRTQAQLITWIPTHNTGSQLTSAQVQAVAAYIKP